MTKPTLECECPVEGHVTGCPNDLMTGLLQSIRSAELPVEPTDGYDEFGNCIGYKWVRYSRELQSALKLAQEELNNQKKRAESLDQELTHCWKQQAEEKLRVEKAGSELKLAQEERDEARKATDIYQDLYGQQYMATGKANERAEKAEAELAALRAVLPELETLLSMCSKDSDVGDVIGAVVKLLKEGK